MPFLAILVLLPMAPVVAQPGPAEVETVDAAEQELRQEVDRLFRVLRLRNGVLLEPREDMDGIAAIEIDGSTFVIDGVPVPARELDQRLGAAADVVRRLGELESARRTDTFGGGRRGDPRPAPAPVPQVGEAPPAPDAPPPPRRPRRSRRSTRTDAQVAVGNDVTIEADEEARDVVVFGGTLTVRGQVIGDAVAVGGSVRLERGGEVTGDLAAVGGSATLEADTEVQGDVISVGNEVRIDDSAVVGGRVVEVPFAPNVSFGWRGVEGFDFDWDDAWWDGGNRGFWGLGRLFELFWNFFALLLLALLACLAYLLARGPVERMSYKMRTDPWKAGLVGLVAQILFIPLVALVCLILVISIIGIPLLALVPFAVLGVVVVAFLGYAASAYTIGNWAEERFGWKMVSPYVAIVVGVAFIQVLSFLADILDFMPGPVWLIVFTLAVTGALIKYAAWTVGFGAALLTRFGTLDTYVAGSSAALPPIPPPSGGDEGGIEPGPLPDLDWESDGPAEPVIDEPTEPEAPEDPEAPWEPDVKGEDPKDT